MQKMGGGRLLGDRKTPSSRAGAGPVSQGGESAEDGGGIGGSGVAAPGIFNSPMGLGGGLWRSMGDGVKDLGSSANTFDPMGGLKNLSDSALTSAIQFNPVDSMKKLGESASNLPKTELFGNSYAQRAKDQDHEDAAPTGAPDSGLRRTKTKTGEPILVSPWRDRKDVLNGMLDSTKSTKKSLLTPKKNCKNTVNGVEPDELSSAEPKSSAERAGTHEKRSAVLPSPLDGIGGMGKNIGSGLQNGMGDLGNSMKNSGADMLGNFQRNMGNFGSDVKSGFGNLGGNLNSALGSISDGVTSSVNQVHTAASNATSAATNAAASNHVLGLHGVIAAPPPLRLPFSISGISAEETADKERTMPSSMVDEVKSTLNFLTTSSPVLPKAPKASSSSPAKRASPMSIVNVASVLELLEIPKHGASSSGSAATASAASASAASASSVRHSPKHTLASVQHSPKHKLLPTALVALRQDKVQARSVNENGSENTGGGGMRRSAGDIGTEIGEIVKEICALTVAFEEERSFLTTAYNRCVKDWQKARVEAQNAKSQAVGNHDLGALARVQDIEALANEIETLCTQLEAARAEISDERQRREEAEDLLRKVKKTLANHIAADRIREEEECKQLRELQSKLDVEIQHRKSLEDELDKSKVQDDIRPSSMDAGAMLNLQKELLAESETRRGLERSMIQLKESYAEQERLRAKECEQQEADMMNLRADLQHERKLRESIEDEMRRARRMPSRSGFLTAANAGSMSISGEKSQRAMLSALLSQAEADQSLLRKEKEAAEAEVRRLMGQLIENASMEKEKEDKEHSQALLALMKELDECKNKLHGEELKRQEAIRRREEAEKRLAESGEDASTFVEEKNAAIREGARLKIQLDALKLDYEAECSRAETGRRENLKLSRELTEVKTSLEEVTAELADVRAKREASELSQAELRSMLELQTEADKSKIKQYERRERDLERVRQDLEFEKKQRLRSEESVQQLRAEMFEDHERHQQKDALMQRELETLRAELEGERQSREQSGTLTNRVRRDRQQQDLLDQMSQLRVDMDLERLTRDAALAEASELKAKVSELAAAKAQLVSEKSEQAAEISRLEEKLKHGPKSSAPSATEAVTGDVSGDVEHRAHLEMLEKEVSSLREEVETLKSSLAASRTENSMLKSRIEEVNAGQDPNATAFMVPGGAEKLADGRNSLDIDHSAKMELEEEKKKWGKERSDMQEQIRKLQLACMEEERESEMARRREAAAREQLARLNMQAQGGLIGPGAELSAISMPVTPTQQASNDPMHMMMHGAEWQLTPEAHLQHLQRSGPHGGSYAQQHVASMKTRFEGTKTPLNSIGKVKETIDVKDVKEVENQSTPKS